MATKRKSLSAQLKAARENSTYYYDSFREVDKKYNDFVVECYRCKHCAYFQANQCLLTPQERPTDPLSFCKDFTPARRAAIMFHSEQGKK